MTYRHVVVLGLVLLSLLSSLAHGQVLSARPRSCLGTGEFIAPESQQLVFPRVYAQLDQGQSYTGQLADGFDYTTRPTLRDADGAVVNGTGDVLRLVFVGSTVDESQGYSNETEVLSTIVLDSQVLTFQVNSNTSALCGSVRTVDGNLGTTESEGGVVSNSGCPYSGDISLGLSIPLSNSYALTTLSAQLIVLDPSSDALHLACYDLEFTPYYPDHFAYPLIRYIIVGLLAAYLVLYFLARFWASYTNWLHDNETHLASSLTLKISSTDETLSRRKMLGAIWFGAWAGRQVVGSGSLRRYVTAEFREMFATAMWISLVGTVAVEWPGFAYPVFAQTAWTALIYNNSLPFTSPAQPLLPENFTAPSLFSSQMNDVTSPLYLNNTLPNVLLDLESSAPGIEKWARAVGVRAEDLWSICAFTFFVICGVVIVGHVLFAIFDTAIDRIFPSRFSKSRVRASAPLQPTKEAVEPVTKERRSSDGNVAQRYSDSSMRFMDGEGIGDDAYMQDGEAYGPPRPEDDFPSWQLHLALLQGNLTRVLLLFHLPLSLFSVYEFTRFGDSSTSTFALAVVTFAVVCVAAPSYLMWRIHVLDLHRLYTSLPILLSVGPLYNSYSDECSMFSGVRLAANLVLAILIGAAQTVGTAQAAVVLLVEVGDTLVTSLWLPWGDNSAMGPLAFLLSLARIVIAVLLVVISPSVGVSLPAASWIAYIVLLVQGLVILLLLFVLIFKFFELVIRFLGDVPFDESRSPRVGGLSGALLKWDRGGRGKNRRGNGRRGRGGARAGGAGPRRRHDIDDLRRRNQHGRGGINASESSVGTRTHLLGGRGPQSQASSLSYPDGSAAGAGYSRYAPVNPQGETNDEGFIMSAMSQGPWPNQPGYVKPGAYSSSAAGGPVLRSGPTWEHQVTVVQAPPTSAAPLSGSMGYVRSNSGGRNSNGAYLPGPASTAYPPYPPGNPRRMSQSAIIEMATSADASPQITPTPSAGSEADRYTHPNRPSLSHPPSSSGLLSNTARQQYISPAISPAIPGNRKAPAGFFGRFRKSRGSTQTWSDFDSDDEEEEELQAAAERRGPWGLGRFGFGKKKVEEEEEVVEEPPVEERGFSVTRNAKPRFSQRSPGGTPVPPAMAPSNASPAALTTDSGAPHVAVEAPSPPASPHEERPEWRG